jgi:hypothetical protein
MSTLVPRIVLLTGDARRHAHLYYLLLGRTISPDLCLREHEDRLAEMTAADPAPSTLRRLHLSARDQAERDLLTSWPACAGLVITRGTVHDHYAEIIDLHPDLIVCFGCSIIRPALLDAFPRRILNVHLGLSPWYRGSGTNYWPMVWGALEYVGATFMWMDAGIDTGEVIHQIRARVYWGDTPALVSARLIRDMASVYARLVAAHTQILPQPQIVLGPDDRAVVCKKKDYTEASVQQLYRDWTMHLDRYLEQQGDRRRAVPLVEQPWLSR